MRMSIIKIAVALVTLYFFAGSAQAQKTIHFAYQNNLFMAPVFVAFEKGWFDKALDKVGYRMDRREINVGPAVAEAMAGGRIDIGQLGVAVVVTAAGRGLPVKVVANTGIAGEGIVVKADSSIHTLADLRGKKIAIPAKGNMQDYIVRRGIETAGLDPEQDVQFMEIAAPDQKQALMQGLVDAIVLWEPLVTDAVLGGGRLLATGQEILPDHDNDTITATDTAIAEHPQAIRAIVETIVKAQQWVIDNPDEAQAIAAKYLGLPRETIKTAWNNIARRRNGRPNVGSIQEFSTFLSKWGYVRQPVNASELVDTQFLPIEAK